MGCCGSKSNEITPEDTPKKRPLSLGFQEKEITDSSRVHTAEVGEKNNNEVKKPVRPVKEVPPAPAKEIDVETLVILEGHDNYVDVAAWSPVEDQLVTGSTDKQAFLWKIEPHQAPDKVVLECEDLDSPVSSLGWSQDGAGFSLGHDDGKVSLWTNSGTHVFTWWPHEAPVTCVTLRGPGKAPAILSAGDCSAVSQFIPGAAMQELTQLYMTNNHNLTWVEWIDSERFLCADASGTIQLHNFDLARLNKKVREGRYEDKEEAKRTFNSHTFGVYQVKMKPESTEIFASCSVDSDVKVWNLKNKKDPLVHNLDEHLGYVTTIEWIPGTDKLISSSFDYSLKIWDTRKGELLHSLEKHKDAVTKFSLSSDLNYLVSSGQDGDIHFWDAKDGTHITSYEGAGRIMNALWNCLSDKVVVTTYKVVTVLEASFDLSVRNQRKAETLQQYSKLIAMEEPVKVELEETKESEPRDKEDADEKHEKKKHKKRKHRDKKEK